MSQNGHKKWICDGCLISYTFEQNLDAHIKLGSNEIKACLPNGFYDKFIQFKNFKHKEKVPYVIYCDFEAILKPIQTCNPNPENSFTNLVLHEPCSFAYYIICHFDDSKSNIVTYRSEDCGKIGLYENIRS